MFLPIGVEGRPARRPVATMALVTTCVVVHFLAWPVEQQRAAEWGQAFEQLVLLEAGIESRFLGSAPSSPFEPPASRLRGRTETERKFWAGFSSGRLVDEEDPDLIAWRSAVRDLREAREARLYYRYGTHDKNDNPLSLLTHVFLHAGHAHLIFNMIFLWVLGSVVETTWGPRAFLLVFFVSGVAAGIPDALFTAPRDVIGVGASGAIAGIMGAFLIRHFRKRIRLFILPMMPIVSLPAWLLLPLWFALELRSAASGAATGVAHWVHVGGFVFGAGLGAALRLGKTEEAARATYERKDRARLKAEHLELARLKSENGDVKGMLVELEAAARADPDDIDLRRRHVEQLATAGRADEAWVEGQSLLKHLWTAGNRDAFADCAVELRAWMPDRSLPAAVRYRLALALEPDRPRDAASELWRLAQEAEPGEPVLPQALRLYADLLERLGDPEGAARVRARAEQTAIPGR